MLNKLITFEEFTDNHLIQLHQWLQVSHVREFWDDGDRTLEQVKNHYSFEEGVKRYFFFIDGNPAGYLQSYVIDRNNEYYDFSLDDKENIGIDFFIGNKSLLGKGFAVNVLAEFVLTYCQDVVRLIVDPKPSNSKAIHIYEKYGFTKVGELMVENSNHLIMAINLRRTVRAIVFNKKREILLMHVMGGPTKKNDQSFWCTLGGRIEKNETIEETLKRELQEEAGVTELENYQLIAFGEQVLKWNDFPTRLIEKFYAVHVEAVQLHATNLTEEESEIIKDYRWWDISDLSNTNETIYPGYLPTLANQYINEMGITWVVKEIDLN